MQDPLMQRGWLLSMIGKRLLRPSMKSRQDCTSAIAIALLVFLVSVAAEVSRAATLPTGFSETRITNALTNPTAFELAPDGRIFVCQQAGQLRVIKNGALLATPRINDCKLYRSFPASRTMARTVGAS